METLIQLAIIGITAVVVGAVLTIIVKLATIKISKKNNSKVKDD